jgi:uncharacterized membrane protein
MNPVEYRAEARRTLAGNWLLSALVALIAGLLGGLLLKSGSFFSLDEDSFNLLQKIPFPEQIYPTLKKLFSLYLTGVVIFAFVSFFIGSTVRLGYCQFLLDQRNDRKLEVRTLFSHFFQYVNGFTLGVMTTLFTYLWSLLFVIPGIIASYRYAMAPFIQCEHPEYTAMESIAASKRIMQGHKAELFCLDLSFIGWSFLNLFTLGLGSPFLHAYRSAAHAAFYEELSVEV